MGAALLGQCQSQPSPGRQLAAGLDVISSLFSLRNRRVHSVNNQLQSTLREVFPLMQVALPAPIPKMGEGDDKPWIVALEAEIERLQKTPTVSETLVQECVLDAWNAWYGRFWNDAWDTEKMFLPRARELLAAAAGRGPHRFLDHNREGMTIRRWSEAFAGAVSDLAPKDIKQCPFWLAAPALRELGFSRDVLERVLPKIKNPNSLGYQFRSLADKQQLNLESYDPDRWATLAAKQHPAVLIVGTDALPAWKPIKKWAALMVTPDELGAMQKLWGSLGSPLRDIAFRDLAFSLPMAEADLTKCDSIHKYFENSSNRPPAAPAPHL